MAIRGAAGYRQTGIFGAPSVKREGVGNDVQFPTGNAESV